MKGFTKIIGIVLIAFLLFALVYIVKYSMGVAPSFELNPTIDHPSILIATQRSDYKDEVVRMVTNKLQKVPYHIQVVDIGLLDQASNSQYDKVIIIHTWEYFKAPKDVRKFIRKSPNKENIYTLATSGDGYYHLEDVDGITSASRLVSAEDDAHQIINWVLNSNNIIP